MGDVVVNHWIRSPRIHKVPDLTSGNASNVESNTTVTHLSTFKENYKKTERIKLPELFAESTRIQATSDNVKYTVTILARCIHICLSIPTRTNISIFFCNTLLPRTQI